jgi:hypothetical protein
MIKYRAEYYWNAEITKIEVEKETGKSVWYKGYGDKLRQERKRTDNHEYFDTWEEAHDSLIEKAQIEVDSKRRQLELSRGKLGNIKGMKCPEVSHK